MLLVLVLACNDGEPEETEVPGGSAHPQPTLAAPTSATARFPLLEGHVEARHTGFPELPLLEGENRPGRAFARRFLSSRQGVPPGPVALARGDGLLVELNGEPMGDLVLSVDVATRSTADGYVTVRGLDARDAVHDLTFPFQTRAGIETVTLPLWQHTAGLRVPYFVIVPDTQGNGVRIETAHLRAPSATEREAPTWIRLDGISVRARFYPAARIARLKVPEPETTGAPSMPRLLHFAWAPTPADAPFQLALRGRDDHGQVVFRWQGLPGTTSAWNEVALRLPEGVTQLEFESAPKLDGGVFLSAVRFVRARLDRPDVFVITGDTLRADHLGCYGSTFTETPNLDALATRGLLWERMYSVTNSTNPAHTSLFTSLYPKDHGVHDNRTRLDDDAELFAELLAAHGYRTFAVTAARHIGPRVSNLEQGIDRIADADTWIRSGADVVDEARRLLPLEAREPLFAWFHFFDPHTPYRPKAPYDRKYYEGDPTIEGDEPLPEAFRRELVEPFPVRDPNYPRAQYRAEVDYLDHEIGRLLAFLETRRRPCILLFVGDHGESMGEHGNYFNHRGLFPQNLHVPCLLVAEGTLATSRHTAPTSTIDLLPTLCELLDLPVPRVARGASLLPVLRGERAASPVFAEHANELSAGWLDGDAFHVLHVRPAADASRTFQIRAGTLETLRLGNATGQEERTWPDPPPPAVVKRLNAWRADVRPLRSPAAELSPTERADLERLGYTQGRTREASDKSP